MLEPLGPRAPRSRLRGAFGLHVTVLDPSDRGVIGCVYIYPDQNGADVSSWVRATHAGSDAALRELVSRWLSEAWPFERISYAGPA